MSSSWVAARRGRLPRCGSAQAGVEVTVVEQGQPVQPRRHALAKLTRGQLVPDSNYCFGEGGAGTFSDGKLYTRSKDRAAIGETLATLIEHGADPAIGSSPDRTSAATGCPRS